MSFEELEKMLSGDRETEHLEFKESKGVFSILGILENGGKNKKSVYGYCVAIGNEGGGHLIFGVKDKVNSQTGKRDLVGTDAIQNIQKAKEQIFRALGGRIEIEEIQTNNGKIQIIKIPPRSVGEPFKFYGVPLMRNGEELVEMDSGTLRSILNESREDFSAKINKSFKIDDLDENAVQVLKNKWAKKSGHAEYEKMDTKEALSKMLLLKEGFLTNAVILLAGKENTVAQYLPNAEFDLQWRLDDSKTDPDSRSFFRGPFVLIHEKMWEEINNRNLRIPFKQGFIELDIWSFDRDSVREAILNAFAHREYFNRTDPTFIKFSPEKFSVKSPGGFVAGVTKENALFMEGKWRNRLMMEAMEKIGLVEREGIGLDKIYMQTIKSGKGFPNFDGTDSEHVVLNIPARVRDVNFVYYLQKISAEKQISFNHVKDFINLEKIRESGNSSDKERLKFYLKEQLVEVIGKGRGAKYVLAKNFYEFIDNRSEYTRKKWLNKDEQKLILLNYLKHHKKGRMDDFKQLFIEKELNNKQINFLLKELREEGVYFEGPQRSPKAYWRIEDLKG